MDLSLLVTLGRKILADRLDQIKGGKTLILDNALTDIFSLWFDTTFLTEHGVEGKYHLLKDGVAGRRAHRGSSKSDVYIARPEGASIKDLVDQIISQESIGRDKNGNGLAPEASWVLVYPPNPLFLVDEVLKKQGLTTTRVIALNLPFVPLAPNLVSLELDSYLASMYCDQTPTVLQLSAQALIAWQHLYGLIPRIIGKGHLAKKLADRLIHLRQEIQIDNPEALKGDDIDNSVDSLIIIDRQVDPVTPLCLQLTYEGLIEEIYQSKHQQVELDKSLFPKEGSASQLGKQRYQLDSKKDLLLDALRDLNFAVVASTLNQMAKRISNEYDERHQAKTVKEIRNFVGKLGDLQTEHQNLQLHTGLAGQILQHTSSQLFGQVLQMQQDLLAGVDPYTQYEKLDALIAKQMPLALVLRLLCLSSLLSGGFKPARLDQFKSDILQTYGYDYLWLLTYLDKMGWLSKAPSTGARPIFNTIRRPLKLIVEDVNEKDPQDISYVYSGYAPLSIRLVQAVAQKAAINKEYTRSRGQQPGWRMFENVLKLIPGETFDLAQKVDPDTERVQRMVALEEKRTTLVFFLGGCTSTEVAALRFMSENDQHGRSFVAATTSMINGQALLNELSVKPLKLPF